MNKNAIKEYAVWARKELIGQLRQRAYQYGIDDKGYGDENAAVIAERALSADEIQQRKSFVAVIKRVGYRQAVEEAAYTWFNRLIALRFMEVNDFLPAHVRVLSDTKGGFNPEILKDVLHLDLPGLDKAKVSKLLNATATEELYRYLLLTQCNELNTALPEMFERLGNYTEMLLPNNILGQESVLARLVKDIPEDDWRDAVQIIGWMYQYYNSEPKQAVFDGLKKNVKIGKENIPAATQLFTPDWIVRYLVENSLGRLWLETRPNSGLKANWKYYLDEAEQIPEVAGKLRVLRSQSPVKTPEDITLIDPCMGSGHILVYAFDLLMQIYESEGYNPRDAVKLILEKNLYGLDIDRRAYQLAYFSLMMKARQYNRRIFTESVKPQVYHPIGFPDGEEYGSLIKPDALPPMPKPKEQLEIFDTDYETALRVWNFKRLLLQKYDVVVTNPPYMGSSGMNGKLSDFVKTNYPDSKSDLFAVFIEKCGELLKTTGYQAMITQHAWMFLSSYEKLRNKLIHHDIVNMAHLGARAFAEIGGEVVQSTAFVMFSSNLSGYKGCYVRLVDIDDADGKERGFLSGNYRYTASADSFAKIPGSPVAYWVSSKAISAYDNSKPLSAFYDAKNGMSTTDNNRFLRLWFEVASGNFGLNIGCATEAKESKKQWFPYNKGGKYRKWYGNVEYLVNWYNDGADIKKAAEGATGGRLVSQEFYFKRSVSWSKVSSGQFAVRMFPKGFIFDVAGPSIFSDYKRQLYILALLNSRLNIQFLEELYPTMNYEMGQISSFPVKVEDLDKVARISEDCYSLAKADWDAFETSWDFKRHPLI